MKVRRDNENLPKNRQKEVPVFDHIEDEDIKMTKKRILEMKYELLYRRRTYMMMLNVVWAFQVAFSVLILLGAYDNNELSVDTLPDIKIGLTRFVCGMIMHIQCNDEIVNGLRMMKYCCNHWWKFSNYRLAYLAGFLQVLVMLLITLINYNVITIENNVLDIAKDFTALMIVADFDDIFGSFSSGREIAKDVCSDKMYEGILLIETTTSLDARGDGNAPMGRDPIFEQINKRRASDKAL